MKRQHHLIEFTKASGAGNDFVLIDNMDRKLQVDNAQLARALCSRHFGIGADGLLLLEPSATGSFFMRYYNADGSYGGMCGNGGRCAARYAYLHSIAPTPMEFVALDYSYRAEVIGELVKLKMKDPVDYKSHLNIPVDEKTFFGSYINTGSPHVVLYSEDLNQIDVEGIGKAIRFSGQFAPEGTNVNFVRLASANAIDLRTYERGVEAETQACGTGSVAAAIVAALEHDLRSPIRVSVRSGEDLEIFFQRRDADVEEVYLEGSARLLFAGLVVYDSEAGSVSENGEELSRRHSTLTP